LANNYGLFLCQTGRAEAMACFDAALADAAYRIAGKSAQQRGLVQQACKITRAGAYLLRALRIAPTCR
jgi:type IV pilus assembly protein PilF